MEGLQNKDESIQEIYKIVEKKFGPDFFSLPKFWDADMFALGLQKRNKLVYISTWDAVKEKKHSYFAQFELIDLNSKMTQEIVKTLKSADAAQLIKEIQNFVQPI